SGGLTERCGSGASAGQGDVCLASERSIEWRASGTSETSNPRPKAFSASRFDLELGAQISLFSVGECRWTTTPCCVGGQLIRKQLAPTNHNSATGKVVRRSRLGGMLNYYS